MAVWKVDWKGDDQRSIENYYDSSEVKMKEHLVGLKQKGKVRNVQERKSTGHSDLSDVC